MPYRVEHAELSMDQLQALRSEIASEVDALAVAGIDVRVIGISVATNSVSVGVARLDGQVSTDLRRRFGSHVNAWEANLQGGDSSCSSGSTRLNCWPLMGGLKMFIQGTTDADGKYCTTGLHVKRQLDSALYMMTAGHCIEATGVGANWQHSGTVFGKGAVHGFSPDSIADVGLVKVDAGDYPATKNLFYAYNNLDIRPFTTYRATSNQVEGDFVCRGAWPTNQMCGFITDRDAEVFIEGTFWINDLKEVDFDACPGDSGGPYYLYNTVWGIHSDSSWDPVTNCDPNSGISYYSPIERSMTRLQNKGWTVYLCLTASCNL